MRDILSTIRSRGHWVVNVRPSSFAVKRIATLNELETVIREAHVELRGWDYPHLSREGFSRHTDFIQGVVSWDTHHEIWRLYQSGQFYHEFAMREDWWTDSPLGGPKVQPGTALSLISTLYTITEIFQFSARLAKAAALGPDMVVAYRLVGIADRQLQTFDASRVPLSPWRKAAADLREYGDEVRVSSEMLIARANELAIEHTLGVFERFHWEPAKESLAEEQRRLLERRF